MAILSHDSSSNVSSSTLTLPIRCRRFHRDVGGKKVTREYSLRAVNAFGGSLIEFKGMCFAEASVAIPDVLISPKSLL